MTQPLGLPCSGVTSSEGLGSPARPHTGLWSLWERRSEGDSEFLPGWLGMSCAAGQGSPCFPAGSRAGPPTPVCILVM